MQFFFKIIPTERIFCVRLVVLDTEFLFDAFLVVEDFGKDEPEHTADKTGNGCDVVKESGNSLLGSGIRVDWSIEPDPDT